jgi:hypothetical protein
MPEKETVYRIYVGTPVGIFVSNSVLDETIPKGTEFIALNNMDGCHGIWLKLCKAKYRVSEYLKLNSVACSPQAHYTDRY